MRTVNMIGVFLLLLCWAQPVAADEAKQDGRFRKVDGAIVLDTQTGLMWAAQDNGEDIDWYDAVAYAKEFGAGGYSDWRLPDIEELAALYTPDGPNEEGYFITDAIRITDCCIWSSYETMGGSLTFSFSSGKRPPASLDDTYQLRVLPVRGREK